MRTCFSLRNVGLTDSCKLTLCATGSQPCCFFYRGGVRALSSDEFQEVLRSCFIYRYAKTGRLHSVAFGFENVGVITDFSYTRLMSCL
jgi:hypothetical protein